MTLSFRQRGPENKCLKTKLRYQGPVPVKGDWVTLEDGFAADLVHDVMWDFSNPTVEVQVTLQ
jgi:hypothetical protein